MGKGCFGFENLEGYQLASELAAVYDLAGAFPSKEQSGNTSSS
jgi:hypothetical protein